jgi:ATP-binding cassette subfamily B protein
MEEREINRYDNAAYKEYSVQKKTEIFFGRLFPLLIFFMGVGEFFLLYYVGSRILAGEMTMGEMAMFGSYVAMLYGPLRWLTQMPQRFMRVTLSLARIHDVVSDPETMDDDAESVHLDIEGNIRFENVSFSYEDAADVLNDISFEIKPGEMVGIVGRSGAGKSTLINLVMRLYDVNEGRITIDGTDIRDISQHVLRSQVGAVLQETFLFAGTIYDNIAYAKPNATREEVIAAAKTSTAHEFIVKLPDGYNTYVGERGHSVSGGERQRIAIARALLHNPRILILDEATASLDTETEKQIQDAIARLISNRTTFAIAHRLSTLRNATRIIVIDKHAIAEVGTHDELMRKGGIYHGLIMAQRQMSQMPK